MASSTALATQSKSVRDAAAALARTAAGKARKAATATAKVEVPLMVTAGGTALGVAERFLGPDVNLGGIDNGITAGVPLALVGAFAPGKAGRWLMLMGVGMLASGARNFARDVGAEDDTEGL